jgi:adiponectin receptor
MSSAVTVESYEDVTKATTSGLETSTKPYKRRHSSFHPRKLSVSGILEGEEGLLLKVRPPIGV